MPREPSDLADEACRFWPPLGREEHADLVVRPASCSDDDPGLTSPGGHERHVDVCIVRPGTHPRARPECRPITDDDKSMRCRTEGRPEPGQSRNDGFPDPESKRRVGLRVPLPRACHASSPIRLLGYVAASGEGRRNRPSHSDTDSSRNQDGLDRVRDRDRSSPFVGFRTRDVPAMGERDAIAKTGDPAHAGSGWGFASNPDGSGLLLREQGEGREGDEG
jgi:hypothetical protein